MRTFRRLVLAACAAAMLLAIVAGSASASRGLSIRPGRSGGVITGVSRRSVFRGAINVTCELTLRGEFIVDSVLKSAAGTLPGGLIARITEGRTANCRESVGLAARAVVLATRENPILFRYDGYLGTLPAILGIIITALTNETLRRTGFRLDVLGGGVRCLFAGPVPGRINFPPAGGSNAGAFQLPNSIPLQEGGESCPRAGELEGTFVITPAQELILLA